MSHTPEAEFPAAPEALRAATAAGPEPAGSVQAGKDTAVLRVTGLSARYDGPDVFTDVNLTLQPGETVRVTGPNGAGKSTLLRCVAGVHPVRTGLARVRGIDLAAHPVAAKRHIGYAAGDIPFTYLTGREHLNLGVRVYRLPRSTVSMALGRFPGWALVRAIDTESRRYSHGMRQQLKLLLAILHDPALLVLDEATEGLDDQALAAWLTYLGERRAAGGSLVYVEHRDEVAARFPVSRSLLLGLPAAAGGGSEGLQAGQGTAKERDELPASTGFPAPADDLAARR